MKPHALILQARGTNRDHDVMAALALAGADPVGVPLNALRAGKQRFADYQMLILPGGFSYADALGAGKLLALDLDAYFADEIEAFVAQGRPVIGICNGFQALVRAGLLPFAKHPRGAPLERGVGGEGNSATLTLNAAGHFECRWITIKPVSQTCIWTAGLTESIECPVAHGEGNFQVTDPSLLSTFHDLGQIALVYSCADGRPADGAYPDNPNGSALDIAGLCNRQGNVLGLMPHPENHIYAWQHPQRTRRSERGSGLPLFVNGVRHAGGL